MPFCRQYILILLWLLRCLYVVRLSLQLEFLTKLFQLVGHSMGGSVVTKSCPILLQNKYKIAGVAVLDVVEGSAIDALPHMNSILNARPDGFDSVEEAIEWQLVIFSRQVPSISRFIFSCSVTTNTIQNAQSARVSIPGIVYHKESGFPPYQWRTPLRSTAPYWLSMFLTFLIFRQKYSEWQLF